MIKKRRLDSETVWQVELICKSGMVASGKLRAYILDACEACASNNSEVTGPEGMRTPKVITQSAMTVKILFMVMN